MIAVFCFTIVLKKEFEMGTYYTAVAMIGYKFNTDKFVEHGVRNQCDHTEAVGKTFCPVCGKKVETIKTSSREKFWEFQDNFLDQLPNDLDYTTDYDGQNHFVGVCVKNDEHGTGKVLNNVPDAATVKQMILDVFDPYIKSGDITFNDKDFGLWSVFHGA